MNYVTGYTGFSDETALQSGNFLALKIEPDVKASSVTVELVGGTAGPQELGDDNNWVGRITNKNTQKVRVTMAVNNVATIIKTLSLTGLTLAES